MFLSQLRLGRLRERLKGTTRTARFLGLSASPSPVLVAGVAVSPVVTDGEGLVSSGVESFDVPEAPTS